MPFHCVLNTNALPAEVQRGQTVTANVVVVSASAPVRSVIVSAESYGVSQRLKKVSEDTFRLEIKVPYLVPPGRYLYSVWAVSEAGESSARQQGMLAIR